MTLGRWQPLGHGCATYWKPHNRWTLMPAN
jgi:hypothetical protein